MTDSTRIELPTGAIEYRDNDGALHHDGGPAYISPDGVEAWYQHGNLHRDDGPAYIVPNNFEAWYQNGKLHREDGPAVTDVMGCTEWYHHGARRLDLEREAAGAAEPAGHDR